MELLRAALSDREPVVVREPGGTPLGERIRDLLALMGTGQGVGDRGHALYLL